MKTHKGALRPYAAVTRVRLATGLQYRAAALGGVVTQFFWGALEILAFAALYQNGQPQPMSFAQLASYIWLQQAFLALLMPWFLDPDILEAIDQGALAYEMCRPLDLYALWFAKSGARRVSRTLLRCAPILLVAALLPAPYGLMMPPSPLAAACFALSLCLSFLVVTALCMLLYAATCHTLSARGIRLVAVTITGFLAGEIVPLPFFPVWLQGLLAWLPFGAMQNMPLRVYSGNIAGAALARGLALQVFWAAALTLAGHALLARAQRHVQIQGG